MGYYIRTLTHSDKRVPFSELRAALAQEHPKARLLLQEGSESQWEQLLLAHANGTPIAAVERNSVTGPIGAEELQEFRHEIADCAPPAAATWLDHYLSRVRTIHAFQVLDGTKMEKGWDILGTLKTAIWQKTGGIIQADREGFTNEDGYHGPIIEGDLLDTSYNRDLKPGLVRGGYGSSFMFNVVREEWDNEPSTSDHNPEGLPERTIREVRTFEAGPVTWPASPTATAGMRGLSGTDAWMERLNGRSQARYDDLVRSYEAARAF